MTLCKTFIGLFAFIWVAAFGLFLIGQFGVFGQERDPLSAVFLIPLGLPWNRLIPESGFSVIFAAIAPGVNLLLILAICRWRRRNS